MKGFALRLALKQEVKCNSEIAYHTENVQPLTFNCEDLVKTQSFLEGENSKYQQGACGLTKKFFLDTVG